MNTMGLQEVKSEILNEAEDKADSIIEEAEQERDEIIEEAETEAEKIEEDVKEEIEEKKTSMEKKKLSNARMEARQKKLEAKHSELEKVFEEFREELEKMDSDDRELYVASTIDEVDFEVGKVITGEEFSNFVSDHDVEEDDDVRGVILVSSDGEKRQNFTLNKIVESFRDDYRKEVAGELFE